MLWTNVISDLNRDKIVRKFYKQELPRTNKKNVWSWKSNKALGDKLYVKWKGYDNSFNRWVDKKQSINEWVFSRTEIIIRKSESWIRFI